MISKATKGALAGAACGTLVWLHTSSWQFFAMACVGALCTWMFTHPAPPQPRKRVRDFVRVEIRGLERLAACYDYGGCQWAGDGCKGKPLVLGPGTGCAHTSMKTYAECLCDAVYTCQRHRSGKRSLDEPLADTQRKRQEWVFGPGSVLSWRPAEPLDPE